MKGEEETVEDYLPIPNPSGVWLTKLLSLQAEIIYNCLVSLSSPFLTLSSLASESFYRAQEAKQDVDSAVHAAATAVPSTVMRGSGVLLRKLGLGFLGASYVCMLLTATMVVAAVLGFGLVRLWVEEPLFVRESLYFDYTHVHPTALFTFGGGGGGGDGGGFQEYNKKKNMGVPVGHTFHVSLLLLMPESDFNINIGMFQVVSTGSSVPAANPNTSTIVWIGPGITLFPILSSIYTRTWALCQVSAELISTTGNVISKSSHPCILRFRSLPIRLMRTFVMGIPLLLGITSETQRITIPMLINHKERKNPRTEAIRISLIPRAGTSSLPQLYEAEIVVNSELPWRKRVVHNWKWTFYVWTSLNIYIMLLVVLLCCFRPLVFPTMTSEYQSDEDTSTQVSRQVVVGEERSGGEVSETLRRWQQSRSKRKAMLLHKVSLSETVGSSASSISFTREEDTEDAGDSESVCFRG